MSRFTGPLTITHLDSDWRRWRLEQPLAYDVEFLGSGKTIIAPAGMVTDGASVPQFLWAMLPAWGKYSRAAVIHDFLCMRLLANDPHEYARTRKIADAIFYEAMKACRVWGPIRFVMWAAVRLHSKWKGYK